MALSEGFGVAGEAKELKAVLFERLSA